MANMIKRGRDGKVLLALESTEGFPASELAGAKLGTADIRIIPAELLDDALLTGDVVIACRADGPAAQAAAKALDARLGELPASGYRLEYVSHPAGNALVISGGDLFGMLAGMADAFLHSELSDRGLVYRGGARTERPAFPLRYYWTWDHSTNWVLDDPGNQVSGCSNQYLKQPETYLEDYRCLVDHCIDMRFNGIVIWGFLREAHGGEEYAYEVAKYAADRGVHIMPGLGTTGYGGVYYEGRHPANLETYLESCPERGNMGEDGSVSKRELSPYCPENQEWLRGSLEWLYRRFPIGGANLENSDLMVDHSALAKRERAKINSGEADYFKDQYFAYKAALETAHELAPDAWNVYATYSGFGLGENVVNAGADMGAEPYFAKRMPASAIAQWTLSGMLSPQPPGLREWLEHPAPEQLYNNPRWPKGLLPPTPRSAGFIHQGSQWHAPFRRTSLTLRPFAEACLRGFEAGLEGISVHGEVNARALPWHLNYLAMRHWTYHPESSLEEFALAELAPRLGGEQAARDYVETMCLIDEGKLDDAGKLARPHSQAAYPRNFPVSGDLAISRMWQGLLEWLTLRHSPEYWAKGIADIL